MTNSKSGDILSACIAFAVAASTLTSTEPLQLVEALKDSGAMPQWAFIALVCSVFCLATAMTRYAKLQAFVKFLSGCVWGSMVLILGLEGHLFPLFWIAIILFTFDFLTVIKRSSSWSRRVHS